MYRAWHLIVLSAMTVSACGTPPTRAELPNELAEPCDPLPPLEQPDRLSALRNHIQVAGQYHELCARHQAVVDAYRAATQ